jgi:hypothetical protein
LHCSASGYADRPVHTGTSTGAVQWARAEFQPTGDLLTGHRRLAAETIRQRQLLERS